MTKRLVEHGPLPQRAPVKRAGDPVLIDAITAHLEALGPIEVIHDLDSRWVHLDLVLCRPVDKGYVIVATCGMAERPLKTLTGERIWTELLCVLDLEWPLAPAEIGQPENAWPFTLLRWLARFPHQTGTGYQTRESVGPITFSADGPRVHPYEAAFFIGQKLVPKLAMVGREITFLAACPIYADELAWIRRDGLDVLLAAFAAAGNIPLLIDDQRDSYAPSPGAPSP